MIDPPLERTIPSGSSTLFCQFLGYRLVFLVRENWLTVGFLQRTILVSLRLVWRTFHMAPVSKTHMDIVIRLTFFFAYYVDIKENVYNFYLHKLYFMNM